MTLHTSRWLHRSVRPWAQRPVRITIRSSTKFVIQVEAARIIWDLLKGSKLAGDQEKDVFIYEDQGEFHQVTYSWRVSLSGRTACTSAGPWFLQGEGAKLKYRIR